MSNLFAGSTDLDNIFEPRGSFAKRADVGIYNGSTDISNLYAPVSHGSAAANTGIYAGSTDIGQLFAAKGSVSYHKAPIWTAGDWARTDKPSSAATTGVKFNTSGSIDLFESGTDGTWLPSGESNADYEVKWVRVSGDSSSVVNGLNENSYYNLGSLRQIWITDSSGSTTDVSITVRFTLRNVNDTSLSITHDVTMTASYENVG
ncbi:hypothetical protein [Microbulbifer taiwanensis]|uniref:Uncharacterized protein n=1 Tax=Microbulbifer taiwanensis TaxID=986746 RepID=A0ABW1YLB3_9GAMM|nr:hypothetical protein [Microbulbifer taiwanensis]